MGGKDRIFIEPWGSLSKQINFETGQDFWENIKNDKAYL